MSTRKGLRVVDMFCATHAAAGAAVAPLAREPVSAFLAGAATHAVLDMIPHYDYESTIPGVLDFAVAALLIASAAGDHKDTTAWAMLGGVLPDLEVVMSYLGLISPSNLVFPSHSGLLPHRNVGLPLGVLTQLAVLGLAYLSLGSR